MILRGDTHQLGDHRHRDRGGEVPDHVERARFEDTVIRRRSVAASRRGRKASDDLRVNALDTRRRRSGVARVARDR